MKIVTRADFLVLPEGVVFAKYEPCWFGALCIKGETLFSCQDFCYQPIHDAIDGGLEGVDETLFLLLLRSQHDGSSVGMDFDRQSRDGLFDEKQLFAVWEKTDVEQFLRRLQQAVASAYP